MLLSIKTGGCPEDCAYCPQSAHYETDVDRAGSVSASTRLTDAADTRARAGRDALLHGRGLARCARTARVRSRARHGARRARPRHGSVLHARHAHAGAGRRARGRGAHRLQPQPRHVARVLRQHHHHAHLRRAARHAGARAAGRHHRLLRRHHRHGRGSRASATACCSSCRRSIRIRKACR